MAGQEGLFEEILRRGQACEGLWEKVHSRRGGGKCKGFEVTEKALNSDDSENQSCAFSEVSKADVTEDEIGVLGKDVRALCVYAQSVSHI